MFVNRKSYNVLLLLLLLLLLFCLFNFVMYGDNAHAHAQMIYVDRTICGYINSVRTTSPLSFWTKDMLSIREKYEIKNGGFGKDRYEKDIWRIEFQTMFHSKGVNQWHM
ncbi:hypothetical protein Hanom_Chr15g01374431 [Helianthus anomalus]